MKELLEFAVRAAEAAGAITLEYFGRGVKVETKADASPVTEADRRSEEFLRAQIERRFPEDGILGEEFGEKPGTSGRRWILDPLDGTKSFIRGVPLYATLIALEERGETVLGVVHVPPLKETTCALIGNGCHFNGRPCRVSATPNLEDASAVMTSLNDFIQYWGEAALLRIIRRTRLQRTWGDAYGYTLVARGDADAMLDPTVNPWDVACMIPIIREAGGAISDLAGECGTNMRNTIATNGKVHAAVLALIRGTDSAET